MPTCVRGLCSATSAENCAESATTLNPQTTANAISPASEARKASGESSAHDALTTMAAPATRGLPHASAHSPATTHPIAPLAIMTNATSDPTLDGP